MAVSIMAIKQDSSFSAKEATVLFDGVEAGTLQNLRIQENFNSKEVHGCGTPNPQVILPGFYTINIQAESAILESDVVLLQLAPDDKKKLNMELIFSKLIPYMSPTGMRMMTQALKFDSLEGFTGSIGQDFSSLTGDSYPLNVQGLINQWFRTLGGSLFSDRISRAISFDIEILDSGNSRWKYKDCLIDGRVLSLSAQGILVMSNLTIKSTGRYV